MFVYFSGLSFRATADTVNRNFNLNLRHTTIAEWVKKYIPIISEYVNSFVPKLSGIWHADELYLNVNDPRSIREEGEGLLTSGTS
jgi:transposase-like protein